MSQALFAQALFAEVSGMRGERGLPMRRGTIADATIIAAPPSTKNKQQSRDPERHQTKKANQWHFGMTAQIGVDVASGVGHTVLGRTAPKADINQMAAVLHGAAEDVFADAGYTGADKRPEHEDRDVCRNIAIRRRIINALPKGLRDLAEPVERALAQVRAGVEHPFHIVNKLFRHKKLRYRGLAQNTAQRHPLFALANLVIVKKTLLVPSPARSHPDPPLIPETTRKNLATAPLPPTQTPYQPPRQRKLGCGSHINPNTVIGRCFPNILPLSYPPVTSRTDSPRAICSCSSASRNRRAFSRAVVVVDANARKCAACRS